MVMTSSLEELKLNFILLNLVLAWIWKVKGNPIVEQRKLSSIHLKHKNQVRGAEPQSIYVFMRNCMIYSMYMISHFSVCIAICISGNFPEIA